MPEKSRTDVRKTTKRTGFGRDGEKHVELCIDAGQLFYKLALFSVDMYFGANVTYSNNVVVTDSDFIVTDNTSAIAITADVSFKTGLAPDFKREYKNIEFLWKQRPAVEGMIALPAVASQIPGKRFFFGNKGH